MRIERIETNSCPKEQNGLSRLQCVAQSKWKHLRILCPIQGREPNPLLLHRQQLRCVRIGLCSPLTAKRQCARWHARPHHPPAVGRNDEVGMMKEEWQIR